METHHLIHYMLPYIRGNLPNVSNMLFNLTDDRRLLKLGNERLERRRLRAIFYTCML